MCHNSCMTNWNTCPVWSESWKGKSKRNKKYHGTWKAKRIARPSQFSRPHWRNVKCTAKFSLLRRLPFHSTYKEIKHMCSHWKLSIHIDSINNCNTVFLWKLGERKKNRFMVETVEFWTVIPARCCVSCTKNGESQVNEIVRSPVHWQSTWWSSAIMWLRQKLCPRTLGPHPPLPQTNASRISRTGYSSPKSDSFSEELDWESLNSSEQVLFVSGKAERAPITRHRHVIIWHLSRD